MDIDLENSHDDEPRYLHVQRDLETVYVNVVTKKEAGEMWNSNIYPQDLDVIKKAFDLMGGDDAE